MKLNNEKIAFIKNHLESFNAEDKEFILNYFDEETVAYYGTIEGIMKQIEYLPDGEYSVSFIDIVLPANGAPPIGYIESYDVFD